MAGDSADAQKRKGKKKDKTVDMAKAEFRWRMQRKEKKEKKRLLREQEAAAEVAKEAAKGMGDDGARPKKKKKKPKHPEQPETKTGDGTENVRPETAQAKPEPLQVPFCPSPVMRGWISACVCRPVTRTQPPRRTGGPSGPPRLPPPLAHRPGGSYKTVRTSAAQKTKFCRVCPNSLQTRRQSNMSHQNSRRRASSEPSFKPPGKKARLMGCRQSSSGTFSQASGIPCAKRSRAGFRSSSSRPGSSLSRITVPHMCRIFGSFLVVTRLCG